MSIGVRVGLRCHCLVLAISYERVANANRYHEGSWAGANRRDCRGMIAQFGYMPVFCGQPGTFWLLAYVFFSDLGRNF